MKIGIITLIDYTNYGNRLQNYAVEQVLGMCGYESETIEYCHALYKENPMKVRIKKVIWRVCPGARMKKLLSGKKERYKQKLIKERTKRFRLFSNNNITRSPIRCMSRKLPKRFNYEYICIGSDQVWNPKFGASDITFGAFVEPSKRIGFSASIGVSEIPNDLKEIYTKRLKEMRYISVREQSAAHLIKGLIGKSVDVFLDPTMLVQGELWKKLMKKPKVVLPNSYIVSFFYGIAPENMVDQIREVHNCKVVYLESYEYPEYYSLDPSEMLYVFQHSKHICTDSFHAVVFAIILHKQFTVFKRRGLGGEGMFTRLETLLTMFHMEKQIVAIEGKYEPNVIQEQEFIDADRVRYQEQQRTCEILKGIMKKI